MTHKKILHLSTGHLGGAGIAARNLNYGLNEIGIQSFFVATSQKDYKVKNRELDIQRSFLKKLIGRLNSLANRHISSRSVFTLRSSSSNIEVLLQIAGNPHETIIHIHNWFNLVSLFEIERFLEAGFKMVFTLHDERILTGGCHSTLSCNQYKSGCIKCPEVAAPLKRVVSDNHQNQMTLLKKYNSQITFVAPSIWIFNQAKSICDTLEISLIVINNYIPVPKKMNSSSTYALKKSLVLGVANVDPKSYIKGGDRLDLVKSLIQRDNLDIKLMDLRDFSKDSSTKQGFWNSIDFLLITSRSENSPNVIFEAKGFGLPILTTDVGGIRELLNSNYDVLLDFTSSESVLETLYSLENRLNDLDLANQQIEWAQLKAIDSLRKHSALYTTISQQ